MGDLNFSFQQLFYENMGGQPFYLRKFYEATEYLDEPFSEVTLQVIRLLLGDLQACDSCCQEDSRIEAKVQIGQEKYRVTVVFENGISMFCVTDSAGDDCTNLFSAFSLSS